MVLLGENFQIEKGGAMKEVDYMVVAETAVNRIREGAF